MIALLKAERSFTDADFEENTDRVCSINLFYEVATTQDCQYDQTVEFQIMRIKKGIHFRADQ
jgi:hypothetical protein